MNLVIEVGLNFICGALLGTGIGIGGMAKESSSIGFFGAPLHFINGGKVEGKVPFNPALGVVFASALFTHFLLYRLTLLLFSNPILFSNRNFPRRATASVDFDLVIGSILFGVGWSLGGFCPGPSIVNLVSEGALIFSTFMFVGMLVGKKYKDISSLISNSYNNNKNKNNNNNNYNNNKDYHKDINNYSPDPRIYFPQVNQNQNQNSIFSISELFVLILIAIPFFASINPPKLANFDTIVFPDLGLPYGISANQIVGGVLIGVAISLYFSLVGGTLGISGRISGFYSARKVGDILERTMFIGGLIYSAYFLSENFPSAFVETIPQKSSSLYALGGFIVGFGTNLANGCTSGHGICGVTRFSVRSFVATALFMAANMAATSYRLANY